MKPLIKPKVLKPGDTIATISLSWGAAGEIPGRYFIGKRRLEENFGLKVVETPNALRSNDFIYHNPKARAEDLMGAFLNPEIKAIITNIGGEDSIRILPFMDLSIIQNNPKIFMGFSDSTITHLTCFKARLVSFYGPSVYIGFAENVNMFPYQIEDIKKSLFSTKAYGKIEPNQAGWTSERLAWENPEFDNVPRKLMPNDGWKFFQEIGKVQGRLLGGCMEVLEFLKGTDYFPNLEDWEDCIFFLETSEEMPNPSQFRWFLRNMAAQGILHKIKGLILGRPYDLVHKDTYDSILKKVIYEEEGLHHLPMITGMDFGHTCPVFTLPYGIMAEIDSDKKTFSILEPALID